jgi:hypothetical protein
VYAISSRFSLEPSLIGKLRHTTRGGAKVDSPMAVDLTQDQVPTPRTCTAAPQTSPLSHACLCRRMCWPCGMGTA